MELATVDEALVQPMGRPGYGTLGRELNLVANYFKLTIGGPEGSALFLYRYQIEVKHRIRKLDKDDQREVPEGPALPLPFSPIEGSG